MEQYYDIFEHLADGSVLWRCAVSGREAALNILRKLAIETSNELRAMHLATNSVLAAVNAKTADSPSEPALQ
jgi:hypothetical protein